MHVSEPGNCKTASFPPHGNKNNLLPHNHENFGTSVAIFSIQTFLQTSSCVFTICVPVLFLHKIAKDKKYKVASLTGASQMLRLDPSQHLDLWPNIRTCAVDDLAECLCKLYATSSQFL